MNIEAVAPSPKVITQNYHQFVESQRNLASKFGPRLPPYIRSENIRPMEGRLRGWSNDTARNGRGGRASGNSWSKRNGRGYIPATPQPSPPRPMNQTGLAGPIYVLNNENPLPQKPETNTDLRVFSDPLCSQDLPHQVGQQRAFSESPTGRAAINPDPVITTPLGRRASTNGVDCCPKYDPVKIASPQESHAPISYNSTPRTPAPISNDARVLEAIEKPLGGCGLLFNASPERDLGLMLDSPFEQPGSKSNHNPEQPLLNDIEFQESSGNGGLVHTYFYAGPARRLDIAEQNNRTIFICTSPYNLFQNHTLKDFCSQCGEIDNISFLVEKGHAFVA
jgi:hypothetical protein